MCLSKFLSYLINRSNKNRSLMTSYFTKSIPFVKLYFLWAQYQKCTNCSFLFKMAYILQNKVSVHYLFTNTDYRFYFQIFTQCNLKHSNTKIMINNKNFTELINWSSSTVIIVIWETAKSGNESQKLIFSSYPSC